jgi:hypothetical protein
VLQEPHGVRSQKRYSSYSSPWKPVLTLFLGRRFLSTWWRGLRSSKSSVNTRTTLCNMPRDGILRKHWRQYLKILNSYIALTGWTLCRGYNLLPVRYELGFLYQKTAFFIVTVEQPSNLT